MPRIALVLILFGLVTAGQRLNAGPQDGAKTFKELLQPNESWEKSIAFKGSERAGVMVKTDLKVKADVRIEIRDAKGQVVTKFDVGGEFGAVIWHPTHDATYQIKVTVKSAQPTGCYIVVR